MGFSASGVAGELIAEVFCQSDAYSQLKWPEQHEHCLQQINTISPP